MEQLKERFLRPCRKLTDQFLIAAVITFLLMETGTIASLFFSFLAGISTNETLPSYVPWALKSYFVFSGIWVVFVLVMVVFPANRPMLRRLVPTIREGNTIVRTLLGLLAGFACNGICVAISVLRHDIGLSFVGIDPAPLLVLFCGVVIQSGAEEIVTRLYLQQKLLRRYKAPVVAVILSATFFAALHLLNPGITVMAVVELLEISVILSLFCLYFDALGAAIAMHAAWNYTQNIIFGLPNSGLVSEYSIFKLEAAANGPFFDTMFGVEGAVGSCCVLGAFLIGLLIYIRVKHVKPIDIWAGAEEKARAEKGMAAPSASASYAPRHMAK